MINPFFKNNGPIKISKILLSLDINLKYLKEEQEIFDVKDLHNASNKDITFFHSKKYENLAANTKASYCITKKNLSKFLPKSCVPIEVDNVLVSIAVLTKMFYPDSVTDDFDIKTNYIENTIFAKSVKYGHNILIGKNVKIGSNCLIGHNTIIESNVVVGDNCSIGSNVIIRNTLIKNNVLFLFIHLDQGS